MKNSTMTALALAMGLSALPAMAQSDKSDKAGSPSAAEAAGCVQAGAPNAPESFNKLDDNGDGFIAKQEYIEKCGKAGASAQSDDAALAHFASLDSNRDQKLSADEFKSARTAGAASATDDRPAPIPNQTRADEQARGAGSTSTDKAAMGSSPGLPSEARSASPTAPRTGAAPVAGLEAERIVGMDVVNAEGKEVGEIKDLVLDRQQVAHAVISVGGFLGIGAKDVAVPFEQLRVGPDNVTLMSNSTQAELKQMPEYKKDSYTRIERKNERAALPKQ